MCDLSHGFLSLFSHAWFNGMVFCLIPYDQIAENQDFLLSYVSMLTQWAKIVNIMIVNIKILAFCRDAGLGHCIDDLQLYSTENKRLATQHWLERYRLETWWLEWLVCVPFMFSVDFFLIWLSVLSCLESDGGGYVLIVKKLRKVFCLIRFWHRVCR